MLDMSTQVFFRKSVGSLCMHEYGYVNCMAYTLRVSLKMAKSREIFNYMCYVSAYDQFSQSIKIFSENAYKIST